MSVKGSWTRVADRTRYERNKERIYMTTHMLLTTLGDRIHAHGAPEEVTEGYKQALALRSIRIMDEPEEKNQRGAIMRLHEQLDEVHND